MIKLGLNELNSCLKQQKTTLVLFSAPWCHSCDEQKSILKDVFCSKCGEWMDKECCKSCLIEVDVDDDRQYAILEYKLTCIPAMIIFEYGEPKIRYEGLCNKEELSKFIKK